MNETIEQVARILKAAREAKGLSQRALAERAAVPQSHISKIENGGVDLRLSSLVELSRALNLEVTLVPRKATPAVNAIIRSVTRPERAVVAGSGGTGTAVANYFAQLQQALENASEFSLPAKELVQLQRRVRELQQLDVSVSPDTFRALKKFLKTVKAQQAGREEFQKALAQFTDIRNKIVHRVPAMEPPKPAYSLEDDDHA